jgi:hypothetical protein
MRLVLHLLLFAACAGMVSAQGTISGRVVNASTGDALRDARIFVQDQPSILGVTDLEGRYVLEGLPVGVHTLRVFKVGFDLKAISEIEVTDGKVTRLDVTLSPFGQAAGDEGGSATGAPPAQDDFEDSGDVFELDALTVTAQEVRSEEAALLSDRQRSPTISDALGSEMLSRLSLGDAAEAMTKVTGASVVDGKYVVIRGLGDRYTNTLLNNVGVPSADPDRRAVQLDQFPSDLLESIVTSKSFTPDQPGSFSGGSVNLKTKSFPEGRFVKLGGKIGYNSNTTGEDLLSVPGGGRDWTGMDDGTRALPNEFPDRLELTVAQARRDARAGDFSTALELDRLTQLFDNRAFYPSTERADPNFELSFSLGDRWLFQNEGKLGYVVSFKYDRSASHYEDGVVGRYSEGRRSDYESPEFVDVSRVFTPDTSVYNFSSFIENGSVPPSGDPGFGVTRSAFSVDWGGLAQIAYAPTTAHEITARFFFNQSANDVVKRGVGEAVRSDSGGEFRENIDILYTERSISSTQLEGKSVFPVSGEDLEVDWRIAYSVSTQDQPDYRNLEFKWSYIFDDYDPSGVFQNRYFRDLEDTSLEYATNLTYALSFINERQLEIKVGALRSDGDRTYRGRQFQIQNFPLVRNDPATAYAQLQAFPNPVGLISIDETNNTVEFGTVMRETDSNIDYDGSQEITAGYIMLDIPVTASLRLIGGVRYEETLLETVPRPTSNIVPEIGLIDQGEWLPAVSLVQALSENMNLRLSFGRTLARPTYREMAAVRVYEPFTDEFYEGNPDLDQASIDNYDVRWEWFVRPGELIAVSGFYKELTGAIENSFQSGAIQPQNIESGEVYGVEFEYRQMLDYWFESLQGLTFGLNFAIIESEVGIPAAELAAIRGLDPEAPDVRPLFGQSSYTFNVDASYFLESLNSTVSVTYNVSGERLDLVTTGPLPDVYEQPAGALTLVVSTILRGGWSAKLTLDNLLDPTFEKTLTHEGQEFLYESYRTGRTVSLSVSRDF